MQQPRLHRSRLAAEYRARGLAAFKAGQIGQAVIALRCAAELNPRCDRTWNDLGVAMEALGNPRDALDCYRQALTAQPQQPEARANLNLLLLQMGLAQALQHQSFTLNNT